MRFEVLGSVRIEPGPPLGTGQVARLLGTLLLEAGSPVSPRVLTGQVLGPRGSAHRPQDLYVVVSRLRRLLREVGAPASVEREPAGYRLDVEPDTVDALRFEALVSRARRAHGPSEQLDLYGKALALWRGEVLAGLELPPSPRSRILTETRESAIEERYRCALALGVHHDVLPDLLAACRARPASEGLWALAMQALSAVGRRDEALAAFQEIRRHLASELGIEPSERLRAIEASVLHGGDPADGPALPTGRAVADTPVAVATTAPSPTTPDAGLPRQPTPIPVSSRPFVGRSAELAVLFRFIEEATRRSGPAAASTCERLLSVVGVGGVGKTRLVCEALGQARPAAAHFVDLTAIAAPTDARAAARSTVGLDVLATNIGAARGVPVSSFAALLDQLRDERTLLVLDNAEHLPQVGLAACSLLERCQHARLVVTSRQPLDIDGEAVLRLGPLAPTEAEDLLVELAARADRHGPLPPAEVAALCRVLDGLPLAIELAVSRLPTLSLPDLVGLLEHRLGTLRAVGSSGRHASLVALVTWSTDLLPTTAQTLFRRLAVFAGGFDLAAVLAVCPSGPDPWDTVDDLDRLVHSSLVVVDHRSPRTRYRLPEPIRAVAADVLAATADAASVRDRHVSHLTALVAGAPRAVVDDTIRVELPNLRAAVAHTIAVGDVTAALALIALLVGLADRQLAGLEVEDWANAALELPGAEVDPNARWAHLVVAGIRNLYDDLDRCRHHVAAACEIERRLGLDVDPHVAMLAAMGDFTRGEHDSARAWAMLALRRAREDQRAGEEVGALLFAVSVDKFDGRQPDPSLAAEIDDAAARSQHAGWQFVAEYTHGIMAFGVDDAEALRWFDRSAETATAAGLHHLLLVAMHAFRTLIRAGDDLAAARRGLADALGQYAPHCPTFGVRRIARDYFPLLVAAGEFRTVASLDGAAHPTAYAAHAAAEAVAAAQRVLGPADYEEARRAGTALDDGEVLALLVGAPPCRAGVDRWS